MSKCKIENIETVMSLITNTFRKEQDILNRIKPRFEQLKLKINTEIFNHCVEKYINAELDFKTPGNRGLGRMTDNIPRFGAYFRKKLSKLSQNDLDNLYIKIQDIIISGYLVHALFMEEVANNPVITDGETLYEKWIPGIYASSPFEMGKNLSNIFYICIESSCQALKDLMGGCGIKAGGFLSADKTDEILVYYACAGFGLRTIEVGKC